jgi:hypothetical protein
MFFVFEHWRTIDNSCQYYHILCHFFQYILYTSKLFPNLNSTYIHTYTQIAKIVFLKKMFLANQLYCVHYIFLSTSVLFGSVLLDSVVVLEVVNLREITKRNQIPSSD